VSQILCRRGGSWGNAEGLARKFHDLYEELAPSFGYETRQDTREFDPTTPNGRLMIAVCERLLIGHNGPDDHEERCYLAGYGEDDY